MKKEDHLKKADRIESSIEKLDSQQDWELITEAAYGAAMHYIAHICETRLNMHREAHKGLIKFLRENNLGEIATLFEELDQLRMGRWYGNKTNGNTSELALEALEKIKDHIEDE